MEALNSYFLAAVAQQIERGNRLVERIPRGDNLSRELYLLVKTCEEELTYLIGQLQGLLTNTDLLIPASQPERLRIFRRITADMSLLESIGIAAIERFNEGDTQLNRVVERIVKEINYPSLPPVVSSLSQGYFHIYNGLNLMFVPPGESDFLLHLPDIYHELAHPLLAKRNDIRVQPFQASFSSAYRTIQQYLYDQQHKMKRRSARGPSNYEYYIDQWEKSWLYWLMEFFCDLFATCTVGPAFAWSHLHLYVKQGQDPYWVPVATVSSHPPDYARMHAMLICLNEMGFEDEVSLIKWRWDELVSISGTKITPEYQMCFPTKLLADIVSVAFEGIGEMNCRIVKPNSMGNMSELLLNAWNVFWNKPDAYVSWEKIAIMNLKENIGRKKPL